MIWLPWVPVIRGPEIVWDWFCSKFVPLRSWPRDAVLHSLIMLHNLWVNMQPDMAAGCREFTLRRYQIRQIQITLAQYIVFRKREIVILHPNLEWERHPIILFLLIYIIKYEFCNERKTFILERLNSNVCYKHFDLLVKLAGYQF